MPIAQPLEPFTSSFICPNCGNLDLGNFCSQCGEKLKLEFDDIKPQLTIRLFKVGFIKFDEWINSNENLADYHQLKMLKVMGAEILLKEYMPQNGLNLEFVIMANEPDLPVSQIREAINNFSRNRNEFISTNNNKPRSQRPRASNYYLEKIIVRCILIKVDSNPEQDRDVYNEQIRLRVKTGVWAGNAQRFLYSQHVLKSQFVLVIGLDQALISYGSAQFKKSKKAIFDLVAHQAEIITKQITAGQTEPRPANKVVALFNSIIDGFKDYFKTLIQYIKNPYLYPRLIVQKNVISPGKIVSLFLVGLVCSVVIPWTLTGGFLNAGNLTQYSNLPPFISDIAELFKSTFIQAIVCLILHIFLRFTGAKGSYINLLLCYLFFESFFQIIERPLAYLLGQPLLDFFDGRTDLYKTGRYIIQFLYSVVAGYFLLPILRENYRVNKKQIVFAYFIVLLLYSFYNGFVDSYVNMKKKEFLADFDKIGALSIKEEPMIEKLRSKVYPYILQGDSTGDYSLSLMEIDSCQKMAEKLIKECGLLHTSFKLEKSNDIIIKLSNSQCEYFQAKSQYLIGLSKYLKGEATKEEAERLANVLQEKLDNYNSLFKK